jgi:hypothetical protein
VESVILEALGYVDGFDAGGFFEASDIEDEFVSAAGIAVGIEDRVVRAESRHDIVGVQEGDLGGVC